MEFHHDGTQLPSTELRNPTKQEKETHRLKKYLWEGICYSREGIFLRGTAAIFKMIREYGETYLMHGSLSYIGNSEWNAGLFLQQALLAIIGFPGKMKQLPVVFSFHCYISDPSSLSTPTLSKKLELFVWRDYKTASPLLSHSWLEIHLFPTIHPQPYGIFQPAMWYYWMVNRSFKNIGYFYNQLRWKLF